MTATEAPPEPLMPTDVEIDGMRKQQLLAVITSHGLPATSKMTEKDLRPWARAVVHGARGGTGTPEPDDAEPEPGPEPVAADAEPDVVVPLDTHAVDHVETVELEPVRVRGETVPDVTVWARIEAMAKYLFKSSLRPSSLKNENDVGLVLLAAYDLGIPSSFAMQKIHVQNGRMGMMGELMSALILRDGHQLRADVANDATVARVWGKRDGDTEWTWAEFTIDDALNADLCQRDPEGRIKARSSTGNRLPWELYTADMLYWRALARLARRHFSDCLGGISYTPDELGWAIDVETGDELTDGRKPYGRAGEPEPTMTLRQQCVEMQNRLAELPEDLRASIKEDWVKRGFPAVLNLSVAAVRVVRGWVEAAEAEVARRDEAETAHIPEAEEVTEQTGTDPDPARSGDDGVEGSPAADRDASEPTPVETPEAAEAPQEPAGATACSACHKPFGDGEVIVYGNQNEPYHMDCSPFS